MQSAAQTAPVSKKKLWAGIIISALPVLNLLFAGYLKLAKPAGSGVVEDFARLGYPESVILGIGILEIACTVVYLIPRTSVLGAILLTGYLGGAVATHVRIGDPSFNIFAPIFVGALVWGGLYLRDERLRGLIPLRSTAVSKKMLWAGYVVSAIPVLTLLFAGVMKGLKRPEIVQDFERLGYAESLVLGIGFLELACMIVYVIPGASVLGAILVTGYLGGAVATHVRVGDPSLNIIMPILFGAMAWGGLYLRDERLRELIPFRS